MYRIRRRGLKLPVPQQGVHGFLYLRPWQDGFQAPQLKAVLADENGGQSTSIPDLFNARVVRITGHGFVIHGYEVIPRRTSRKSNVDSYRQTWWCLVHTERAQELFELCYVDGAGIPRRPTSSTGF